MQRQYPHRGFSPMAFLSMHRIHCSHNWNYLSLKLNFMMELRQTHLKMLQLILDPNPK